MLCRRFPKPALPTSIRTRLYRTKPSNTPDASPTPKPTSSRKRKQPSTTSTSLTLPPAAGSQIHTSLPSFLTHATRTHLSPASPLYLGLHYEYTVLHTLSLSGLRLTRVGGPNDLGIDLRGTWSPPSLPPGAALRIVAQCKRHPIGPDSVRELVGAMAGEGHDGGGLLGLLISTGLATRGVREAIAAAGRAVGYVQVHPETGWCGQWVWNAAAEEGGLGGITVGMRYTVGKGTWVKRSVVLMWEGRVIRGPGEGDEEVRVKVPGKRGRPKKAVEEGLVRVTERVRPRKVAGELVTVEKRGRPRKVVEVGAMVVKKRGRPRKENGDKVVEVPRRRGRPRKEADVGQVMAKKRGRPPKAKAPDETGKD
ncbi:hypothetical protein EJ06DRAFT_580975 [Trichodelitschia bisporula]|uniref:Restriction endonuclease type IV Mrr domain-containing protein n=1 Tax=Trichodelitschia bisporula TaxID=703511 RepID=A0A6G1I092_9PEZI|nr:hypothetical protein EJ06DRAFT_580975 [Trichodelitschia bisporula]